MSSPNSEKAHARGDENCSTAGSAVLKSAAAHLRNVTSLAPEDRWRYRRPCSRSAVLARRLEGREIVLGRLRPCHRAACRVSTLAHGIATDVICQQAGDLGTYDFGITKRHENA